MNDDQKLANFKVEMINLVQSSIPIDGTWRIRIFPFDRGLSSKTFVRVLAVEKDKTDAQLFLNSLQANGGATWLYQSFDKVLAQVEAATKQGEVGDIVVNIFTDGENNGGGLSFKQNVARFVALRQSRAATTEFYYHAMPGYKPPQEIQGNIAPSNGVFLVYGVRVAPRIRIKPLALAPSTSTPVQFVATKILGTVERWSWDFGDGASTNEEIPTHQYAKPGEYWVVCTAANSAGVGTDRLKIVVAGQAPVADFDTDDAARDALLAGASGDMRGKIPVQFKDKSAGVVASWAWNFGDVTSNSTGQNPVHWYAQPGTYEVTLGVQNGFGTNQIAKKVAVLPEPVLRFTWSPQTPRYGEEVQFANDSNVELLWNWDFGNGQKSTERNPKTAYAKPGVYSIRLVGVTQSGRQIAVSNTIAIRGDQPPKASFILSRTNLMVGEGLVATDTSTGPITNRAWSFGDRTSSQESPATHVYAQPGTSTITLTVTGPGGRDEFSTTVLIEPAVVTFEFSPAKPVEFEPARFINRSQGPFKSWVWKVDGAVVGTDNDADYTFAKPGPHAVELTGRFTIDEGPAGASGGFPPPLSTNMTTVVGSTYVKPKIAFALLTEGKTIRNGQVFTHTAPVPVQLTNFSTGSIQSWVWDFGDGTTNNLTSPKHQFDKKGRYRVSLALKSARGEIVESAGDLCVWVDVLPPPPFPGWARWPAAALVYLAGYLAVRFSPWQRRVIRFQDGVKPALTFRSWKADPHFLADTNGWTEAVKKPRLAAAAPEAGASAVAGEFRARLTRNAWLRKQYRFVPAHGDARPFSPGNRPLTGRILVSHSYVNCGEDRLLFQTLNDKPWTGLLPQAGLAAAVVLFLSLTWHLWG